MVDTNRQSKAVQTWFLKNIQDNGKPYFLDKHQAQVVADQHLNTIVTARAGSGKTRTLIAKIIYLIVHDKIPPEQIIVFAFNKKACLEINQRLSRITHNNEPIFQGIPQLATTFHAYAYSILKSTDIQFSIVSEQQDDRIIQQILQTIESRHAAVLRNKNLTPPDLETTKQFINRAEQNFFQDYSELSALIQQNSAESDYYELLLLEYICKAYHKRLDALHLYNFNQLIAVATSLIEHITTEYQYILIDEYQDFSKLFLELTYALRKTCPTSHLLVVGDDWQAINRFAGSDVKYFQNFSKYFPKDSARLFIPSNYRSGKSIVKNANYFMSRALRDYQGCNTKSRLKGEIYHCGISDVVLPHQRSNLPLLARQYLFAIQKIIQDNPNKSIKILHRNNNLGCADYSLQSFCKLITTQLTQQTDLTYSTIHRSKGLEADIVILLEIDAGKFPSSNNRSTPCRIFGDTPSNLFADECRLFYVAITRAKEKLYILSKKSTHSQNNDKPDFLNYLNHQFLHWL